VAEEKPEQVPFRASPRLMGLLRECARRHQRPLAEELRIAVELHVTKSLLEALPPSDSPERDKEIARAEERLRVNLAVLTKRAYTPVRPNDLLDNLVWLNERLTK
jgi:hypothetical protein